MKINVSQNVPCVMHFTVLIFIKRKKWWASHVALRHNPQTFQHAKCPQVTALAPLGIPWFSSGESNSLSLALDNACWSVVRVEFVSVITGAHSETGLESQASFESFLLGLKFSYWLCFKWVLFPDSGMENKSKRQIFLWLLCEFFWFFLFDPTPFIGISHLTQTSTDFYPTSTDYMWLRLSSLCLLLFTVVWIYLG
jgi:hypothetical protein